MNRKTLSSIPIIFLSFLIFSSATWCGEVQTVTLGGKPLTLTGEKLKNPYFGRDTMCAKCDTCPKGWKHLRGCFGINDDETKIYWQAVGNKIQSWNDLPQSMQEYLVSRQKDYFSSSNPWTKKTSTLSHYREFQKRNSK